MTDFLGGSIAFYNLLRFFVVTYGHKGEIPCYHSLAVGTIHVFHKDIYPYHTACSAHFFNSGNKFNNLTALVTVRGPIKARDDGCGQASLKQYGTDTEVLSPFLERRIAAEPPR